MRRAPIVITATVLGTAAVLLFKPVSPTSIASAAPAGGTASSTPSGSATSQPSGSATSSTAAGSTPASSSTAKNGTVTGDAKTTRFGTTQVKVTISGGRITEVTAVQLNQNDPRSVQISQDAAPLLRSEVLSKQTAAVDVVSGATYTSAAYEASLQSALDKAGYAAPDASKASTAVANIQESGGLGH